MEFTPGIVTTDTVISLTTVLTLAVGVIPTTLVSAELFIDSAPWAGGVPISLTVSDGVSRQRA